jgi:hypothetical protein
VEFSSILFVVLPLLSKIFTRINGELGLILIEPLFSLLTVCGFAFILLPRFRGFIESLTKIISGLSQQLLSVEINGKNSLVALQNAQINADNLRMGDDSYS